MIRPRPWILTDIDGVLNNQPLFDWFRDTARLRPPHHWLHPTCLQNLEWLVNATGARLAITSSWRRYLRGPGELEEALARGGLSVPVVGVTPDLEPSPATSNAPPADLRAREVAAFLSRNPAPYVILEDVVDWCRHFEPGRYVTVSMETGLTFDDAVAALQIIQRQEARP